MCNRRHRAVEFSKIIDATPPGLEIHSVSSRSEVFAPIDACMKIDAVAFEEPIK